jgi:16S rRNA (adenine1518-N6/adenine1519-N6)-dimethyltransferase
MQTQTEIRRLLEEAGLSPRKAFGQCFLIDGNLMGKLLELADVTADQTVLEVGPGTGSLTEELLHRARRVVAVEIDRGLAELLRRRLGGRDNLTLIGGDVLAGKHEISPAVLAACGAGILPAQQDAGKTCLPAASRQVPAPQAKANLVSNLPYNIATPLLAECLLLSWRALGGPGGPGGPCRFERLTFTVQKELAERLVAEPGGSAYGPVSVLVALLGRWRLGPIVPATAFWPAPKVASRIVRIDFDAARAGRLADARTLSATLATAFGQRRKQVGTIFRRAWPSFAGRPATEGKAALEFLAAAGIDPTWRPEQIDPQQYLDLANRLTGTARHGDPV